MTTTPASLSHTPSLTDGSTLAAVIDCSSTHLKIDMDRGYMVRELFEILLRTTSQGDSIEQTVRALAPQRQFHSLPPQ
jgi:hypothetical protein